MQRNEKSPVAGFEDIAVPSCPEQAAETLQMLAESTRRSFLGRGLAVAAVPATILAGSSLVGAGSTKRAGSNSGSNSTASNATGNGRTLPSYFPGQTAQLFQEIQVNEASHVDILISAIRSLGGTPRPYPTFQGIDISNAQRFLTLSNIFENTGVHAYFGAAGFIQNPNVLAVAASIAFVEGYHAGWLNSLAHMTLVPGGSSLPGRGLTYATPLGPDQVGAAVMPFIASLNDPNDLFPPTFSTVKSPQNDLAILNYALLTEYLEATFYFNSVPKVFPGTL